MTEDEVVALVTEQMVELQAQQSDLQLVRDANAQLAVEGPLRFSVTYGDRTIEDEYDVAILIPRRYPDRVPTVRETGGKVSNTHHRFVNGALCLEAPVEVRRVFAGERTLLAYVNRLVVPYLSAYSYKCLHDRMPHGERKHGPLGILDYYTEFFRTDMPTSLRLLKLLADYDFPRDCTCPCGRGASLYQCHGSTVLRLCGHLSQAGFAVELQDIVETLIRVLQPNKSMSRFLKTFLPSWVPCAPNTGDEQKKSGKGQEAMNAGELHGCFSDAGDLETCSLSDEPAAVMAVREHLDYAGIHKLITDGTFNGP